MLPVASVVRPSSLLSQPNGNLDPSLLVSVHKYGQLHFKAADCWLALTAAAAGIGLPLTFTYGGMYRNYADQVTLFRQRYAPTIQHKLVKGLWIETRREWFAGQWWWLKPTVAGAAKPGTSNHGLAIAIDMAFDTDPTDGLGPDDAANIGNHPKWGEFVKLVPVYGFSWESQDEPWHVRMVSGDTLPAAVLAWKAGAIGQLPAFDPDHQVWGLYPLNPNKRVVKVGSYGDDVKYLQGVLKLKAGQTRIGTLDGKFGPRTEAAVKAFQQYLGLVVDGWVGKQTWGWIDKVASA